MSRMSRPSRNKTPWPTPQTRKCSNKESTHRSVRKNNIHLKDNTLPRDSTHHSSIPHNSSNTRSRVILHRTSNPSRAILPRTSCSSPWATTVGLTRDNSERSKANSRRRYNRDQWRISSKASTCRITRRRRRRCSLSGERREKLPRWICEKLVNQAALITLSPIEFCHDRLFTRS